jgi:myotubularin-related protein 1/2
MALQTPDKEGELRIYDARPYLNAVGQRVAGKGFESEEFYKVKIEFLDIHNIHRVRESYVKL